MLSRTFSTCHSYTQQFSIFTFHWILWYSLLGTPHFLSLYLHTQHPVVFLQHFLPLVFRYSTFLTFCIPALNNFPPLLHCSTYSILIPSFVLSKLGNSKLFPWHFDTQLLIVGIQSAEVALRNRLPTWISISSEIITIRFIVFTLIQLRRNFNIKLRLVFRSPYGTRPMSKHNFTIIFLHGSGAQGSKHVYVHSGILIIDLLWRKVVKLAERKENKTTIGSAQIKYYNS